MIRGELRVALAGVLALVTLVAFEAMAVGTAMPVVAAELGGLRSYGLAFSLFLTTSLLGMVLAGGWNDARGPLWPTVSGLALFCGGLVVSGLAPTFAVLLAGRAVAGLGGGVIVVTLYVVVGEAFPEALRPRVFAWMSSGWVLPSLVGPPLGGWLAEQVTWRLVFLGVPPVALLSLVVLVPRLRALPPPSTGAGSAPGSARRRAVRGLALAAGAALAQGGAAHLVPVRPLPVAATVLGAVLAALALPGLLPAGTLRAARGLPSVVAARGLFTTCFTGAEAYVPLMLVLERGVGVTVAGLSLTGAAVGWTLGSFLQGRPGLRVPRHRLMGLAGAVVTTAVALLVLPALHLVPGPVVLGVWALGGLGMGLGLSSTGVLVLAMAPPEGRGTASSALQLSDALGSVVGIAVAGAFLAARTGAVATSGAATSGAVGAVPGAGAGPQDGGLTFALIFAGLACVGVLAAVVGSRVRPPAAASAASSLEAAPGAAASASVAPL